MAAIGPLYELWRHLMKLIIIGIALLLSLSSYASNNPLTICSDKDSLEIKAIDNLNKKLSQISTAKIGNVYFLIPNYGPFKLTAIRMGILAAIAHDTQACVDIEEDNDVSTRGIVVYSKHYHESQKDANQILQEELEKYDIAYQGNSTIFQSVGAIAGRSDIKSYMATVSILTK